MELVASVREERSEGEVIMTEAASREGGGDSRGGGGLRKGRRAQTMAKGERGRSAAE